MEFQCCVGAEGGISADQGIEAQAEAYLENAGGEPGYYSVGNTGCLEKNMSGFCDSAVGGMEGFLVALTEQSARTIGCASQQAFMRSASNSHRAK